MKLTDSPTVLMLICGAKKIKESILDDFPGLGKVRRAALLEHFGSIEKMRKATVEDLCAVEGFGKKMAERLFDF